MMNKIYLNIDKKTFTKILLSKYRDFEDYISTGKVYSSKVVALIILKH